MDKLDKWQRVKHVTHFTQFTFSESQSSRLSVFEPVLLVRLSPWSLASLGSVSVDMVEVTVRMGGAGGGTPGLTML